jgi:hypothetical protein
MTTGGLKPVLSPISFRADYLNSFRVPEALESGCTPIVPRRPFYDYFEILLWIIQGFRLPQRSIFAPTPATPLNPT